MRFAIGIALLAAQLVMIGVARFHPMRFYTWAPFDSQNEYQIGVTVGGHALTAREIEARYKIASRGVNPRSLHQVVSLIEYVESVYRLDERASVEVIYRTNGGPVSAWRWPR